VPLLFPGNSRSNTRRVFAHDINSASAESIDGAGDYSLLAVNLSWNLGWNASPDGFKCEPLQLATLQAPGH
jgi:hypothetical protein